MPAVFVLKAVKDGTPVSGVFDELKAGRARIGWSWKDHLDLRSLLGKLDRQEQLDKDEQYTRRCLGFLTRVNPEDYLVYPHQPERKRFVVVQVKGDYDYSTEEEGLDEDFRSFRPCLLITQEPVDMYDGRVASDLRYRMGVPGRFSQISDPTSFFMFLETYQSGPAGEDRQRSGSKRNRVDRIHDKLRGILPEILRREFSRADLSRNFCSDLFKRMGYTPQVQEGPHEAGSDLVVEVNHPLLPGDFRIGVQVFAYKDEVEESSLRSKLEQLLEGWDDNSLDYGVLLTTGRCTPKAVAALIDHNKKNKKTNKDRPVRLIEGDELADLFLKYFPPGSG